MPIAGGFAINALNEIISSPDEAERILPELSHDILISYRGVSFSVDCTIKVFCQDRTSSVNQHWTIL